jgi:hypothetical protein
MDCPWFYRLNGKTNTREILGTRKMTDEGSEQLVKSYLAAKQAVLAYGLSEDDDQHFTTASSNSVLRLVDLTGIATTDSHIRFRPAFYVPVGSGKTTIILSTSRSAAGKFSEIAFTPSQTIVTSDSSESVFTLAQASTMAVEAPLLTDGQTLDEVISSILPVLPARYSVKLAARLTELDHAVREEEPDSRGIEVRSLLHFLRFLESYPELRCPSVAVSPARNIYASWKSGRDRVFSIHFLPDGNARFVIFYPNEKHAEDVIRLSGTATSDMIMSVAAPHSILSWAADERRASSRF